MKIRLTKFRIISAVFVAAVSAQTALPFLIPSASAGTLTNTMVRFDRLAQAQATTGTVCAKETSTGTDAVASVTFPTGFTVSSTIGNWTVNTTNYAWPTGAIAWNGIGAPTGAGNFTISGQTVNFQSGDLNTTNIYCFNWTNTAALTTGTAGAYTGTVTTETSAPATIDTGTYGVSTVGANLDQITVTATVNQTFSMVLSANSDSLGTLTFGAVSSSPTPRTATVNTNAANGWYAWAKDSNQGLTSATASHTIASNCSGGVGTNSTLSAGTEGYNLGVTTSQTSGTGTITVATPFVGGSTGKGGGLCNGAGGVGYQTLVSSSGTAGNAVLTLTNNAAISGGTNAASDYTDTETFVGAGIF